MTDEQTWAKVQGSYALTFEELKYSPSQFIVYISFLDRALDLVVHFVAASGLNNKHFSGLLNI